MLVRRRAPVAAVPEMKKAVSSSLGLDVFGAVNQLGGERDDARDLFEVHGVLVSGGQRK
jgi:hypothetical protein